MYRLIKELFFLLTADQRKRFYKIQALVVLMAFSEVVGISSIGPFMALVGDITLLEKQNLLSATYKLTGFSNPYDFLYLLGVVVLITLFVASMISMIATYRLALFAFKVGTEISDRLYNHYINQKWLFHANSSSANLTKQVSNETFRVTAQVILPLMHMNARLGLAIFISLGILIYDPIVAVIGVVVFFSAYFILFKLVKIQLSKNGKNISEMSLRRYRLMNEGFGGIRDILLLGRGEYFVKGFKESGVVLARASGVNNALAYVPRYLMELLSFGAMIVLILFLIKNNQGDLGRVLPTLAIYGLASFKLLPALQQIYASVSEIKGNISAFESIRTDLIESQGTENYCPAISLKENIIPTKSIKLKNITFKYPGKNKNILENVNIEIPASKFVGFVGSSGSGKSTVIDLILGLITPDSGELVVDDKIINNTNYRLWQNSIGFVPQSIFLSEGTIAENIAFGVPEKNINYEQILKVVKLAKLEDVVSQLPFGLKTCVGERGVQLSGGQRQRIGIARALYGDASVLVFDEATSALDGITEKLIMDAIYELSELKTVIMIAHRLKTVERCDVIFHLENGHVKEKGSYKELLENDSSFRKMVDHA